MGQIFYACAYDTETRTCYVEDADKFHANCYSICRTVATVHYLLRQKPYRVMWGGVHVVLGDYLDEFSRTEDLLGISTYLDYENFEMNIKDIESKNYYDKIKFIEENHNKWEHLDVLEKVVEYFDFKNTRCVKYSGYLLNHTNKLAIDLADYYKQSKYFAKSGIEMTIDAIPALTETGEGTLMALFDGTSIDTTEELACTWCGDLLQITDDMPEDYQLINCCFAEIWNRARYCYRTFGGNKNGYLLKDSNGTPYMVADFDFHGKRRTPKYVKVEELEDKIRFFTTEQLEEN